MGKDAPEQSPPLLTLSQEWASARDVIAKADDRIHETRKIVFGLFSTLLAAGSFLGKERSTEPALWLGVHLALLGLLITGRFVEQQTFLLQAAAASRAWVLELLTPVEITGIICDRFASPPRDLWGELGKHDYCARKTTYIYVGLGIVSAFVTGLVVYPSLPRPDVDGYLIAFVLATLAFAAAVGAIGSEDVKFARDGMDWSFSATSVRVGEPVHILLVNQGDNDLPVAFDPARLVRIEPDGTDPLKATDAVQLTVPAEVLIDGNLHRRGVVRWLWRPSKPGLWGLKIKLLEHPDVFTRRFIHVQATERAEDLGFPIEARLPEKDAELDAVT